MELIETDNDIDLHLLRSVRGSSVNENQNMKYKIDLNDLRKTDYKK